MRSALLILLFVCLTSTLAEASVELKSHSYIHNPSGETHVVFHLARYKKGLFFGSCGPSTRSLQWEYSIEMKGNGPTYAKEDIEVKDSNFQILPLQSGSILIDSKKRTATVSLVLKQASGTNEFLGNGIFKIKKED